MAIQHWIHDGGASRLTVAMHIHDGTATRDVQQKWVHDGTAVRQVFTKSVITVTDGERVNISGPASIGFNANGTMVYSGVGNGLPNWYTPTTSGIGANYWIAAVLVGGTNPVSGAMGIWLPLTVSRTWSNSGSPSFARSSSIQFAIATDAGGTQVVGFNTSFIITKESNL